jgi:predicted RecA/RadA family phage recombinase
MQNYQQEGKILSLTAPSGGVVAGTTYKIGSLVVVALVSAAVGETFAALTDGVITTTVKTAHATDQAWAEGEKLYWDNSAAKFTKTSTSNTACGYAAAVAASTATTGVVLLKQLG